MRKTLSEHTCTAETNHLLLILSPEAESAMWMNSVSVVLSDRPSLHARQMMISLSRVICVCRLADNQAKS